MNNLRKPIQIMICLVMVFSLLGPAVMMSEPAAAQLHPTLAEMAAETPETLTTVIVQKTDDSGRAEALAESLGGQVTKDLQMINAFAAEMPARAALRLSRSSAVRWVSPDAVVLSTGKGGPGGGEKPPAEQPQNYFLDTLNVRPVWDMGYQGEGITVAVIDSGLNTFKDFQVDPTKAKPDSRILTKVNFNDGAASLLDLTGHGTHVAGIIGGSGYVSNYAYSGVAPQVNLVGLRVSDDSGMATESDTVAAMQWVMDNKDFYDIRVVNLSIQSTIEQSYHDSPLDAAAEILWFNGIVVVASSGNKGPGGGFNTANAAPANDPFVITVGATDEQGTADRSDDKVAPFSAFGTTVDGYGKPEIVAPGKDIISVMLNGQWKQEHPDHVVPPDYFRMSGTSMAAPMVTGAVALLLEAEPDLTPDQVKFRLMSTASKLGNDAYLDVQAALTTPTTESANQGVVPHMLLAKMAMIAYWSSTNGEEAIDWSAVDWDAVNWEAVNWNAVNWNAVNWNAVNWNAVNWNAVNWNAVNWNAVNWNAVNWGE